MSIELFNLVRFPPHILLRSDLMPIIEDIQLNHYHFAAVFFFGYYYCSCFFYYAYALLLYRIF